jgi:energy-coupling factor transporter ATP-binding protein EcfA2
MTGQSDIMNPTPFQSFTQLRDAHTLLLRRHREFGMTEAIVDDMIGFIQRGSATGVLFDAEEERTAAQGLLDYWVAMLYRADVDPPDATLAEFDMDQAPELYESNCPYIGMGTFSENDSRYFFGRKRQTIELIQWLKENRMLALVAPSGSGKSSLIRAGLIPALKGGALPGSADWRYFPPMAPGTEPLQALTRVIERRQSPRFGGRTRSDALVDTLAQIVEKDRDTGAAMIDQLRQNPNFLAQTLEEANSNPVVLVIDQFEELFTLCKDNDAIQAFVSNLISLVKSPRANHLVILTIRSDMEAFIARTPHFQKLYDSSRVMLTPMTAGEMREVIEQPAEIAGLKFADGIVDALIHDLLGEPTALPLLQFTLIQLWKHRTRNRITMEAFQKIGAGRLALARGADAVYEGLQAEERRTAKQIFMALVRSSGANGVVLTRLRRINLYDLHESRERIDQVLHVLLQNHLLRLTVGDTPDEDFVEVAHEALVRNWPALVNWLEEERAALANRRRIEGYVAEWLRLGRNTAGLLDSVQLREVERWLSSPEAEYIGYDPLLRDLVQASRIALEAAAQAAREREEQLRTEVEAARAETAELRATIAALRSENEQLRTRAEQAEAALQKRS